MKPNEMINTEIFFITSQVKFFNYLFLQNYKVKTVRVIFNKCFIIIQSKYLLV